MYALQSSTTAGLNSLPPSYPLSSPSPLPSPTQAQAADLSTQLLHAHQMQSELQGELRQQQQAGAEWELRLQGAGAGAGLEGAGAGREPQAPPGEVALLAAEARVLELLGAQEELTAATQELQQQVGILR